MTPRFPTLTITPTFDRAMEIRGHVCRKTKTAVLFTIAYAICERGNTLAVYTRLTPKEFHAFASKVYPETERDKDAVFGNLFGVPWRVRIYELVQV